MPLPNHQLHASPLLISDSDRSKGLHILDLSRGPVNSMPLPNHQLDASPLLISDSDRCKGLHILDLSRGPVNLAIQDIEKGRGVFFLDPHGDTIDNIINHWSPSSFKVTHTVEVEIQDDGKGKRIVFSTEPHGDAVDMVTQRSMSLLLEPRCLLLDPTNSEYTFGINPLQCADIDNPKERYDTYTKAIGLFNKLWKGAFEHQSFLDCVMQETILQNSLVALIENQGHTLCELPLFLRDASFRAYICNNMRHDFIVRDYWLKTFAEKRMRTEEKQMETVQTRTEILLADPYVYDILAHKKSTIDLNKILEEDRVVLVRLSSGLSDEAKRIIGMLLISELLHAIQRRSTRDQFCIFIDGYRKVADDNDIRYLITEAPKYGIATALIHHERYGELPEYLRQFALGHLTDYNLGDKTATSGLWLRKDGVTEEETRKPKIEEVISEELKKAGDEFKVKSSTRDMSDDKKIKILREGVSAAREIFDARFARGMTLEGFYIQKAQGLAKEQEVVFETQPQQKEALTPPDLSEIPPWQGRREDGMPLEFIKAHYGQWLSAFGAEQDSVFQDQIRAHDPGLIKGVHNQFREEKKERKLRDFVKTRSARVDTELKDVNARGVLRKAGRLDAALRRRQKKT